MSRPARHVAPPPDAPAEDHFVHLRGLTWDDYERVLAMRGEASAPRVAFLEGVLEIMSPSRDHERVKGHLASLLELWLDEHCIDYERLGSWTLRAEADARGAEPDESYVLGAHDSPPARPDLVIEVVWTRGALDKLPIYAGVGVPEVWTWERGVLRAHILRDGHYVESETSGLFPALDLAHLASFLDRPSTSQARRDYRAALAASS